MSCSAAHMLRQRLKTCLRLIISSSVKLKRRCRSLLRIWPAARPNECIRQASDRHCPPLRWRIFIWRISNAIARCQCNTRAVVRSRASSATSLKFTDACRARKAINRCWRNLTRCAILGGVALSSLLMTISSATRRMSGNCCLSWLTGRKPTAIRSH